jgi:hypothetical protein
MCHVMFDIQVMFDMHIICGTPRARRATLTRERQSEGTSQSKPPGRIRTVTTCKASFALKVRAVRMCISHMVPWKRTGHQCHRRNCRPFSLMLHCLHTQIHAHHRRLLEGQGFPHAKKASVLCLYPFRAHAPGFADFTAWTHRCFFRL